MRKPTFEIVRHLKEIIQSKSVLASSMALTDSTRPPPGPSHSIRHVRCPECDNEKAVVAATHYAELMCFCPACEHVWDCHDPDA